MSAKQFRKLQASKAEPSAEILHTIDDGLDAAPSKKEPLDFSMLVGSSDESDGHEALEEAQGIKADAEGEKSQQKSKKKKKNKKNKKAASDIAIDHSLEEDDDALLDRLAKEVTAKEALEVESKENRRKAYVLSISKADFRMERERKRIFGGEALKADGKAGGYGSGLDKKSSAVRFKGAHEGCFIHHRKLFVIELASDEKWSRPEGCAKMDFSKDNRQYFEICATPELTKMRTEFASVQVSHDPNEVVLFAHEKPFCIEALMVLAEIMRSSGQQEQAFQIIRRAVYAVECNFNSSFSPFVIVDDWPRTRLHIPPPRDLSWVGWPWLGALWSYMMGLSSQGLSRTALEVCKLLLAMTLPRDPAHALIHCDFLCMRAGEYQLLKQLAAELVAPQPLLDDGKSITRLDCMLPNFAYSAALADRHLSTGGKDTKDMESLRVSLNMVSVSHIFPEAFATYAGSTTVEDEDALGTQMHAALMRAMLLFPQVLRPLLETVDVNLDAPGPVKSPCRVSWTDLLAKKPFSEYRESKHQVSHLAHARIADSYARARAPLWKSDATLCWLHACAGRLVKICESSLFHSELCESRKCWAQSDLSVAPALAQDYDDFDNSEFGAERRPPKIIAQAMNALASEAVPPARSAQDDALRRAMEHALQEAPNEEEELQRALRASAATLDSQERQRLIDEQDREFQEGLAIDRTKELGALPPVEVPSESVERLVEMGFEASAVERALKLAAGDIEQALGILTS